MAGRLVPLLLACIGHSLIWSCGKPWRNEIHWDHLHGQTRKETQLTSGINWIPTKWECFISKLMLLILRICKLPVCIAALINYVVTVAGSSFCCLLTVISYLLSGDANFYTVCWLSPWIRFQHSGLRSMYECPFHTQADFPPSGRTVLRTIRNGSSHVST